MILPEFAIDKERLAEMLHKGNCGIPYRIRSAFYEAKDIVLKWLGSPDGIDVQNLDRECWSCTKGVSHSCGEQCRHCDGKGVYLRRRVILDRWRLGPYVFHIPAGEARPDAKANIVGLIRHDPHPDSGDCAIAIAWLFARESLKRCAEMFSEYPDDYPGLGVAWGDFERWRRDRKRENEKRWAEQTASGTPF